MQYVVISLALIPLITISLALIPFIVQDPVPPIVVERKKNKIECIIKYVE